MNEQQTETDGKWGWETIQRLEESAVEQNQSTRKWIALHVNAALATKDEQLAAAQRQTAALQKIIHWGDNQLQGVEPEQIIAWMTEAARSALATTLTPRADVASQETGDEWTLEEIADRLSHAWHKMQERVGCQNCGSEEYCSECDERQHELSEAIAQINAALATKDEQLAAAQRQLEIGGDTARLDYMLATIGHVYKGLNTREKIDAARGRPDSRSNCR